MSDIFAEAQVVAALPPPERCRQIRVALGLSQDRIAQEMGVSTSAICRWESGSRRPRWPHIVQYADLMARLDEMLKEQGR